MKVDDVTGEKSRIAAVVICMFALGGLDAASLQAGPKASSAPGYMSLRTEDGLELRLGRVGVAGMLLNSKSIPQAGMRSGLWVEDYQTSVESPIATSTNGQSVKIENLNLQAEARYQTTGNFILITGSVESTTPRNRAINVIFGLPVAGQDLQWWDSIDSERSILSGRTYSYSTYPFSALTDPIKAVGIGIAIPPDSPCDFSLGYDSAFGLHVEIKLGLSPRAVGKLKDRAYFKVLVYRVDSRWGLRDAVRRYYNYSPTFFERRANREGLWLTNTGSVSASRLQYPQYYAFREGGPENLSEYGRLGILTFPYLLVGQRELTHLPSLPRTKDEGIRMFNEYGRTAHGPTDVPGKLEVIRNSALHDADGKMTAINRRTPWGGNSVTFPVDPSPDLYADSNKETVAKESLETVHKLLAEYPEIAGIYMDSIAAWGVFSDFDPNHFPYAQLPLSYDNATGDPVIPNKDSQLEFLDDLGGILHSRGKLLFCNGARRGLEFDSFACDVLGVEGVPNVEHLRTIADQKPALCLLQRTEDIAALEKAFRLNAALGVFTSVWDPQLEGDAYSTLLRKYLPMLESISSAGWEPVTYAEFTDSAVHVERFGPRNSQLYFTLYNSAQAPLTGYLRIETAALKTPACRNVSEVISGAKFGTQGEIKVQVAGGDLVVIECKF